MTPFLVWYGHVPAGAPLRAVSGLALVRRAVLSAQAAGFEKIVVAVRLTDLATVRSGLNLDRRIRADVTVLEVPGRPAEAVEHVLGGEAEVVVALGDRVWVPSVLQALRGPLGPAHDARVLSSSAEPGPQDEPSGLGRVRAALLDRLPLGSGLAPGPVAGKLGDETRVDVRAVGPQWRTVHRQADVRAAETLLLHALVRPTDGAIARHVNRRISLGLSRYLARRSLTPTQLSAAGLLLGLASGPLGWLGTPAGFALAGLCYYVSSVLDGCDGELARLKYLGSPSGAWVGTLLSDAAGLSFLAGLYLGLDRGAGHSWWLWTGLATAGCLLAALLPRYRLAAAQAGGGGPAEPAGHRRSGVSRGPAELARRLRNDVLRADFLAFAALVTGAFRVPFVLAAACAPGALAGLVGAAAAWIRYRRGPRLSASPTA